MTDATKAAMPGVTVQVTNEGTGIVRSTVTDAEGRYRFRDLGLGEYRVEAALQGFQTATRRGVVLTIGREAVVDFEMAIGEISEKVEVTGDAPLVDTTSAGVASLVSREQMADLPLNARDFSQLITLQAGTVQVRGEITGGNAGQASGARISISGARPSSNVFVLDGTEIQTAYGTLPAGVGGATLGLEAVQEFRILTSTYSAQYGRSVGGTVIAASRSGTNSLRGTGYWYHRNDKFDARNFFDRAKPEFRRNQFGGGLGGPIAKNKTFFFVNVEQLRERLPKPLSALVPSAAARNGILPGRTVTVSPVVKPYLALWPMPNGRDFGDGTAEYNRSGNRPTNQTYASVRIDHHITPNSSLFGRYTRDVSQLVNPIDVGLFDNTLQSRNHYWTVEHDQVLSARFVNQGRLSFTRTVVGSGVNAVNAPPSSLDFFSGRGFGTIQVAGLSDLSGGGGENTDTVDALIFADDATYDSGHHSIHFGAAFTKFRYDRVSWGERYAGQWEFGSLVDFLQNGPPTRMRISGFNADPVRSFRNQLLSLYLQDDIRLSRSITVNLGARYEYLTTPSESKGRISNLRDIRAAETTVGDPFYENPGGFLSPRVGLVWDPTGSGTMSVRTGFGWFHEPLMMKNYVVSMTREPPFWSDVDPVASQLVGLFPNLDRTLDRLTREAPQAIHVFEFEPKNLYSVQGSLSVQRQLGTNMVVEIGYVGTRGIHLPGRKQWDVVERTVVNGETYFPPTTTTYVNPHFTRLHYYDTSGKSAYNALKGTLTKRFSRGIHFQGAYTWSKSMDTESATVLGELTATSVEDPWNPMRDWGPSLFHVGHAFTGSVSYQLPWGRQLHGVAGALGSGWQVSAIVTAAAGRPFSVYSNAQLTHRLHRTTSQRPDLIADGNNNPIIGRPGQWFDPTQFAPQRLGFLGNLGRNTLVGPGLSKLDVSMIKDVSFGANRTIQLRAEVFNVLNRTNLGDPDNTLFNARGGRLASAGRITSTATTARQGQVAIRVTF